MSIQIQIIQVSFLNFATVFSDAIIFQLNSKSFIASYLHT